MQVLQVHNEETMKLVERVNALQLADSIKYVSFCGRTVLTHTKQPEEVKYSDCCTFSSGTGKPITVGIIARFPTVLVVEAGVVIGRAFYPTRRREK